MNSLRKLMISKHVSTIWQIDIEQRTTCEIYFILDVKLNTLQIGCRDFHFQMFGPNKNLHE